MHMEQGPQLEQLVRGGMQQLVQEEGRWLGQLEREELQLAVLPQPPVAAGPFQFAFQTRPERFDNVADEETPLRWSCCQCHCHRPS
jgi:hypothetical protein